jgi:hypothetical protein
MNRMYTPYNEFWTILPATALPLPFQLHYERQHVLVI